MIEYISCKRQNINLLLTIFNLHLKKKQGINNKLKLVKRISFGFKNKKGIVILKAMLSVLITSIVLPQFFK